MQRNEFIKILSAGSLLACASCLNSEYSFPAPSNVDFTLDLTQGENTTLQSVGGWLIKNGVIIVRSDANKFVVFSKACTDLGAALRFEASQNRFVCPRHYSYFDINGFPLNGPAKFPLRKYDTQLNGDSLRVFSFA